MNDAAPERPPRSAEMLPEQPSPLAGTGSPPPEPALPGPGADEPVLADGVREDSEGLREELSAALAGAEIGRRERHFMSRLVTWHRANAGPVVSLLWKARLAGRAEASMTPQELDTVIGALRDAARYRESGADTIGCWDCENVIAGSRCEEHSRDFDKARDCLALAQVLAAIRGAAAKGVPGGADDYEGSGGYRGRGCAGGAGRVARAWRRRPEDRGEGQLGCGRAPRGSSPAARGQRLSRHRARRSRLRRTPVRWSVAGGQPSPAGQSRLRSAGGRRVA